MKVQICYFLGSIAPRGEQGVVHSQLALQDHGGGDVRHLWKIRSHQTDQSVSICSYSSLNRPVHQHFGGLKGPGASCTKLFYHTYELKTSVFESMNNN